LLRILTILAVLLSGTASVADESSIAHTQEMIDRMFAGSYSTAVQVAAEQVENVEEVDRYPLRHIVYARIVAPHLGENVYFRQTREGGIEAPISSIGLVMFEPDVEANAVRVWLRQIINPEKYYDMHKSFHLWDDVVYDPELGAKCPFYFRADGDTVVGTMDGGRCEIFTNGGERMAFERHWVLSEDGLLIMDKAFAGDGTLLEGPLHIVPAEYKRLD
jgi:hypothetical protein